LKKVGVVSGFIKKSKSFLVILAFSGISQNCFFIEKVMHQVYGSRDHGCLSVHGGPATMGQRDRSGAREVIVVAQRERERRSSGFSPMTPLGGGAAEMAIQQRSKEAAGGAPMGRWFRMRGGEIGVRVGTVDNRGALVVLFIGT
jgi:hypothetical protein